MWLPTFGAGVVRRCVRAGVREAGARPRRRSVVALPARGTLSTCGVSLPRPNPPSPSGCIRSPMRTDAHRPARLCRRCRPPFAARRHVGSCCGRPVVALAVLRRAFVDGRRGGRLSRGLFFGAVGRGGPVACATRRCGRVWCLGGRFVEPGRAGLAPVRPTGGVALVAGRLYLRSRLMTARVHRSWSEHLASSAIRFSSKCVSVSR